MSIHDPGRLGSVLISSESEARTSDDLVAEFGIELLDDYLAGRIGTERYRIGVGAAGPVQKAVIADFVTALGGEVNAMHVLLGEYDLCFCVTLPGIEEAMKASVALGRLTGISFTTCPAVTVEAFDSLVKL